MTARQESTIIAAMKRGASTSIPKKKHHIQTKRVRFAVTNDTCDDTPFSLDEEIKKELWYDPKEFVAFRRQAGHIFADAIRTNVHHSVTSYIDFPRGLEHCTVERSRYRRRATRLIVVTSKELIPEITALVAKGYSSWNREIALVQACHDYCHVYQPSMISSIPAIRSPPALPPSPLLVVVMQKRAVESSGAFERNVRQRVMIADSQLVTNQ